MLPAVPPVPARPGEPALAVPRDRPYTLLTLLDTVMLRYMPLLSLVLPLWIARHTAAPAWLVAR